MWDAFLTNSAAIVWLVLAIAFFTAEALSTTLISIWFAVGAILAMIVAVFGGAVWLQILIFIAASGVLVLATKPLSEKLVNKKAERTNADRVIGERAIVTQTINNQTAQGQVRVLEQLWTARSADGTIINENKHVIIKDIQGVKLIVESVNNIKED
ncbi:MAG: NfeD family protein [Clostridia bacterium]|nr:NfeD family protein [Clostridia bacterium]